MTWLTKVKFNISLICCLLQKFVPKCKCVLYVNIFPFLYFLLFNTCLKQGCFEGWDAMKPPYWRSVNNYNAGQTRLSHHYRGWWNEMNEISVEKLWNKICGRRKWEKPWEKPTLTGFVHHETHMTPTRDLSSGRQATRPLFFLNIHQLSPIINIIN